VAKRLRPDIWRTATNATILIACLAIGVFLHRNFTQVELTFINQSGHKLSDIQLYQKPNRYYLGTVAAGDDRIVSIPVGSIRECRLSFVPENLHRKYYTCPEYLFAGAHAVWVVLPGGTVKGKTAVLPFLWHPDNVPFEQVASLRE
jgi:hypothetical protein